MSLGHKEDMFVITERLYIAMECRYHAMYHPRDGSEDGRWCFWKQFWAELNSGHLFIMKK